jgi:hypothetical protein
MPVPHALTSSFARIGVRSAPPTWDCADRFRSREGSNRAGGPCWDRTSDQLVKSRPNVQICANRKRRRQPRQWFSGGGLCRLASVNRRQCAASMLPIFQPTNQLIA